MFKYVSIDYPFSYRFEIFFVLAILDLKMAKNRGFLKIEFFNFKTGENQNRIILAKSQKGPASFGEI